MLLDEIPDPTEAMTWVLRNIGDTSTEVAEDDVTTTQWDIAEQVRFMANLAAAKSSPKLPAP